MSCSKEERALTQKYSDIKLVNGVLQLQKTDSRGYYMQLQLAMFCTGLKTVRLPIWSPHENVILTVQYDEDFVKERVQRLRGFLLLLMNLLVDE